MTIEKAKRLAIDLIFPRRCPCCDKAVPYGAMIHDECVSELKIVKGNRCYKCSKLVENEEDEYCYDCQRRQHKFEKGIALYEYNIIADSIYKFKYFGRCEYAEYFGMQLAKHFRRQMKEWQIEGVLPVPMYKSKERNRGYNQAQLLAEAFSKYSKIPLQDKLIIRTKKTIPMKELDPYQRQLNLKNAFNITQDVVKLKRIVILDDVYTTGSTIDEIAGILKQHGVREVYFITLAVGTGL